MIGQAVRPVSCPQGPCGQTNKQTVKRTYLQNFKEILASNNLVLGQIVSSSSPDICVVSKDMIMMERRIRGGIYVH